MRKTDLLRHLNLDINLFDEVKKEQISLDSPIYRHAGWVFKHICSKDYPGQALANTLVVRKHHGMEHICRAAFLSVVWANFFRKYGYQDALRLTAEDVKLIQIALLFHDSARVNDLEDDTDRESGQMLYYYLLELGVDKNKATLLAEAVANKDSGADNYWVLKEHEGHHTWEKSPSRAKNIYQILIHDSDCIDIIRVRNKYKAKFLDFFQKIVMSIPNIIRQEPFDDMAHLITEVRHLIEIEGDTCGSMREETKACYQTAAGYLMVELDATSASHPLLSTLYNNGKLISENRLAQEQRLNKTPFNKEIGLTQANLCAALNEGKVFVRGVLAPSGVRLKNKAHGNEESMASLELRKAARRLGFQSQTAKANNKEKQGNKNRSVSLVGFGGGTYSNAGFILLDPPLSSLSQIHKNNATTGRDKKIELDTNKSIVSDSEKQEQLSKVHNKLKQGGVYKYSHHTEVVCDLTHFDAIYFNQDRCLGNGLFNSNRNSQHQYSGHLQAIYLQHEYFKTHNILLPIVHYSRFQHAIPLQNNLTEPELLLMWEKMCADYISSELDRGHFDVLQKSSDDIKIASMYGPINPMGLVQVKIKKMLPGDSNYAISLQNAISASIDQLKVSVKKSHEDNTRNSLPNEHVSVLADGVYDYLIIDQSMSLEFKNKIGSELNKAIQDIDEITNPWLLVNDEKTKRQLEKIYTLAVLTQEAELITKLQRAVTITAWKLIESIKNSSSRENIAIHIESVYSLIEHYNCFDECQEDFIELMRYRFKKSSMSNTIHNKDNQWWQTTHSLIELLYKIKQPTLLSALETEIQMVITEYHQVFKQFVMPPTRYYIYEELNLRRLLDYYLNIARLTNLSTTRQKNAVLDFFSQCKVHHNFFIPENNVSTLKYLQEAGLLNDNEVFQEVIYHFDLSVHDLDNNEPTESFDDFFVQNRLNFILQNLPEGKLTRSQRRIVTQKFVGIIKEKGNDFIKLLDVTDWPPPLIMTEELQAAISANYLKEKLETPSTPDYVFKSCFLFAPTRKKIEGERVLMDELSILNKDFSFEKFKTLVNQSSAEALVLLLTYLNTPKSSSAIIQTFISIARSDVELLPKLKIRAASQLISQAKLENLNIKDDSEVQDILKTITQKHPMIGFFENPPRATHSSASQTYSITTC